MPDAYLNPGWPGFNEEIGRTPARRAPRRHPVGRPALLLLAAVLLAGCGPRGLTPATTVRPPSTATLRILNPLPGAVVTGRMLHVRLQLTGGTVTPLTSNHLTPNLGHIHLSVDGRVINMSFGVDENVAITPGDHLLLAEFVAQDHFPFNPRVVTTATFTVK